MEAAAAATAVLFVVDASAPFSRGELDFLRRAADRVDTVFFALTKIDQYRGWREVLDTDRALLAEHAPRFARAAFHPVSARLFEHAAAAPTPATAALLRERSGVADLQIAVQREVAARADLLAAANGLRTLATGFAEVSATLAADERALSTGAGGRRITSPPRGSARSPPRVQPWLAAAAARCDRRGPGGDRT